MLAKLEALAAGLLWCCSRVLVLRMLFGTYSWVQGDLNYYRLSLDGLAGSGWARTMVEYPVPGICVLAVPWLVVNALGHPGAFTSVFVTMVLLLDAAYLLTLRVIAGAWRSWGPGAWMVGVPLLGATTYARFDLVPGVLLGLAVLLLGRRPGWAAGAAAFATGVKFWPAVVLPALAARLPPRWQVVRVVLATGGVLAALSLTLAGRSRLLSPFTWQAERGLNIESVPATPAMLGWSQHPGSFTISLGSHLAYEISGTGVPFLLHLTTVALAAYAVGLLLLWWRAWRLGTDLPVETVAWLCLAAVSGFVVTGKVLSPQYLLWLLPIAAAALVVARAPARPLVRWTLLLLLAAALTQLVFPVGYGMLLSAQPGTTATVLVLALRNLLLVWLSVAACRESWRHTKGSGVVTPASASAATISSRLMPSK